MITTFQDYIQNELNEDDNSINVDYEYDDYSIVIEIDYTSQE
jgi:frataxin-like iron-binding protein CyaY